MRLVVGSVLVVRAGLRLWGDPPLNITVTSAILLGSGILLILGLWTPIAGSLVALVEALEDPDATRRQIALAVDGNRQRRPRYARTRFVVGRCSSLRMEAGGSPTSKARFELSLSYSPPEFPDSKVGCDSPPWSLRFVPIWGCARTALRRIIRSLTEPKAPIQVQTNIEQERGFLRVHPHSGCIR